MTAIPVPRPRDRDVSASSPTLDRLLTDELAFSPTVHVHYSSHLAMALVALHQLGASPDVLHATFDRHADGDAELRDDGDELARRVDEVVRAGIAATVADRVGPLAAGPASQLFHPMIRLAYALDVEHAGQTAAALLDWERRHEVFPVPSPRAGDRRLRDVAADLVSRPAGSWHHTFDFPSVARRPELHDALDGVAVDEHTLDDISAFALAAHTVADDFITLHLVTGARAVRAVSRWVDDDVASELARHAVVAMAVAYAAVGAPPLPSASVLDDVRRSAIPTRHEIAERAIGDRDPHVIKLANVALVEEARTGDPLLRFIAARVVGLVPSVDHMSARRD